MLYIFTESTSYYSAKRFREEADKLSIPYLIIEYGEILIDTSDSFKVMYDGRIVEFSQEDQVIFRASRKFSRLQYLLIERAYFGGCRILNKASYVDGFGTYNKLYQYSKLDNSLYPETYVIGSIKQGEGLFTQGADYIAKPINGTRGEGVERISNLKELKQYSEKYAFQNTLIQRRIQSNEFVRVVVLGSRVLGAVKVINLDATKAAGNSGEGREFKIEPEIESVVQEVCKVLKLEYAGIDIMYDRDSKKWLVIEVNRMPAFKRFEGVLDENVAGAIIDLLVSASE